MPDLVELEALESCLVVPEAILTHRFLVSWAAWQKVKEAAQSMTVYMMDQWMACGGPTGQEGGPSALPPSVASRCSTAHQVTARLTPASVSQVR